MDVYRLAIATLTALALSCRASDRGDAADTAPADRAADSAPAATPAGPGDTISQRPVDIVLTISSSGAYDGTYQASGISRACGNVTRGMPGRERSFTVEFPSEGDFEIVDLSFQADTLTPGSVTEQYHLSVSLKTKQGARPPSFVLRANEPAFREVGKATLTVNGGTALLKIDGKKDGGETLDMTIVCKPKQS